MSHRPRRSTGSDRVSVEQAQDLSFRTQRLDAGYLALLVTSCESDRAASSHRRRGAVPSGQRSAGTLSRWGRPRSGDPARSGHVLVSLPRAVPRGPSAEHGARRVRAGRVLRRAHARARDRLRPARRRRGVDRRRGRERRRRRHRRRRRRPHPDRPGRQGDPAARAREQHGAVVVLVGMGHGHQRDGHRARGSRSGADQRAGALVHGLRRVGLRRRRRSRPRDRRSGRGARRLDLAHHPS